MVASIALAAESASQTRDSAVAFIVCLRKRQPREDIEDNTLRPRDEQYLARHANPITTVAYTHASDEEMYEKIAGI